MKVCFIGAGSFVFGPGVLAQLLLDVRVPDLHLALVDLDAQVLASMARIGERMAAHAGVRCRITTHAARRDGLAGADFVVTALAVQMQRRFAMDCEIIAREYPQHVITEFGGVSGIGYSLRQIALFEGICADIRELCPRAWLLNSANPLPRVCQATHRLGVRTAGFCSVAISGYEMISRLFGETERQRHPYAAARARFDMTTAGVNHFCWVLRLRAVDGGTDLLPALRQRVLDGATSGNPNAEQQLRETGHLLVPPDHHTADFLAPTPHSRSLASTAHGTADQRAERLARLARVAGGEESWDGLLEHAAWERPGDALAALAGLRPTALSSINLVNEGQIPQLPRNVFVETPATVDGAGFHPQTLDLPPAVAERCNRTAHVTDLVVQAALARRRSAVEAAVEADPTIVDKTAGLRAMTAVLEAHRDLIGAYA